MPPNTGNESQGLKIATILLSILCFLLLIATYFGFSTASQNDEQRKAAEAKATKEAGDKEKMLRRYESLKLLAGYEKLSADSEPDVIKAVIDKDRKEISDKINAMSDEVAKAIRPVQEKGGDKSLSDALTLALRTSKSITDEPQQTLKSYLERMTDLTRNNTMLTTALAMDNLGIRKALENVNTVNDQHVREANDARDKANESLRSETTKMEDARKSELARHEEASNRNREYATKISQLETDIGQQKDQASRERTDFLRQQTDLKDRLAKTETVLDVADGKVTFIDYRRNEVRIDLTRAQGLRPQMKLAIFDRAAPGLPTDRPKAMIMVTQVGDKDSVASITVPGNEADRAYMIANPIYAGDQVYSSVWSPNEPRRIALVGKIDMNRDGADDRADLKRMIEAAGGIVEYDLPPPFRGREYGTPSGALAMYVIDERNPIFTERFKEDNSEVAKNFEEHKREVIKKLREQGVQPMPVERLLPLLGYSYGSPKPGQAEAFDRKTFERLRYPQGRGRSAAEGGTEDSPGMAEPNQDQP